MNQYIGVYQIVDLIGTGGMGEVYRALHNEIGRVVALKVLSKTIRSPESVQRFLSEARIQARLKHPNIATLYDFFDYHGQPCMVMECVDGQTLEERIQSLGCLTRTETEHIFIQIADAVCYIHEKGIVHRDIKPNNIKITPTGDVKLLDFGIAREVISDRLTRVGNYVGTPQYLAPERLKSVGGDNRSDIWSLGILLYEMITGSLPFAIDAIPDPVTATSLRFTDSHLLLSNDMSRIISKCLAIKPGQRYQSVSELLQVFTACSPESMGACSNKNENSPESGAFFRPQAWIGRIIAAMLIPLLVMALFVYHPWLETKVSKTFPQPDYPQKTLHPAASTTRPQSNEHALLLIETNQDSSTPTEVFIDGVSFGSTPIKEFEPIGREFELMLKRNCHKILTKTIRISPTNNQYKYTLQRDQDQCHF